MAGLHERQSAAGEEIQGPRHLTARPRGGRDPGVCEPRQDLYRAGESRCLRHTGARTIPCMAREMVPPSLRRHGCQEDGEEGEEVENNLYKVRSFKEKPSLEVAKKYVKNGGYLWNAGMFIYKLSTMMHAFQKYMPQQYETLDNLFKLPKLEFYQNYATTFASLEKISIDYGVMEKADNIYVTKGTFEWDDLGSWLAIDRHHQKDENGNIAKRAKVLNHNTRNTTIVSSTKKMFVTIGLEDMVIVNTNDVILIAKKDHIDEVKDVVNQLKGVDNNKYI